MPDTKTETELKKQTKLYRSNTFFTAGGAIAGACFGFGALVLAIIALVT